MILEDVPTIITVASGKGGVGKTFVSVELARTIAATGTEVGLLDVDLTTPDTDHVASGQAYDWGDTVNRAGSRPAAYTGPEIDGQNQPVRYGDLQVVSKGIDLPDYAVNTNDERMLLESMMNFIQQVQWDNATTHVVIDTPPGTGTVIQNILRDVQSTYGYIVTTGTVNSVRDACRTHELFLRVGMDHAIIANMRYISSLFDHTELRERLRDHDEIDETTIELIETTLIDDQISLHDEGVDIAKRFSVPIVADLPFTTDTNRIREDLRIALNRTGLSTTLE